MEKIKKILKTKVFWAVFLVFTFLVAILIWYSPVVFKGYSAGSVGSEVILARNYAQTGLLGMESDLNVVVAPELVKQMANPSSLGNKLQSYSFSLVFKIFNKPSWNLLLLISSAIFALSCIFFTLTIKHLYGIKAAIFFPFIYLLLPTIWQTVHFIGIYEFSLLYFSIFIFLYFTQQNKKGEKIFFILSGIFLAAACLAREAFFIFLAVFFLWFLFQKKCKKLLYVFIPAGLLILIFWLPGFVKDSDYLKFFVKNKVIKHSDFHFYGHIYPDPYTYHFNAESVKDKLNVGSNKNNDFFYRVGQLKAGVNMGVAEVNLGERLVVGTTNLGRHLSKYFAIEYIGGPLITLLIFLGLFYLRKNDRKTFIFYLYFIVGPPLILSYVVLAIRDHLMDYAWILALLVSLGIMFITDLLKEKYQLKNRSYLILFCFLGLLICYNLILANHVYWGRAFDNSSNLELSYLADKINAVSKNIKPEEVIAVGERQGHPLLNLLTNKSVVYFAPATIKELAEQNILKETFKKFNVFYAIGYDTTTSQLIKQKSQATILANWPAKEEVEKPLSYNKKWLLNLIK